MVDFINSAVAELGRWNPLWAYLLLAASAFLENLIPPVPGDVVVIFSAYLVGRGVLEWIPVYACTCLGGTPGLLGDVRARSQVRTPPSTAPVPYRLRAESRARGAMAGAVRRLAGARKPLSQRHPLRDRAFRGHGRDGLETWWWALDW